MEGRDLIASAQTGTGKTAAFLLPMFHRLMARPRGKIRALILTPTRELAVQIDEQAMALGFFTQVNAAAVYGGVSMYPQEQALKSGVDIIVATPGRLLDHLGQGYVSLDSVEILVLDEADRMLDMGFLPDITRILDRLPSKLQTLLFSATLPPQLVQLIRHRLNDPLTIRIGKELPAKGVRQFVCHVSVKAKARLLHGLLRREAMNSVLVFARMKIGADRLSRQLAQRGVHVGVLHGGKDQAERERTLRDFRNGTYRVLVATDVASRGLDVEGISHVINYDVPRAPEDYVHRVGRTARVEQLGDAITLCSPEESKYLADIERFIGGKVPVMELPGFQDHGGNGSATVEDRSRHGNRRRHRHHSQGHPGHAPAQ
ncbi:MAG: DEAD/DEAH box helicase [Nitrospirae bacterium]|nr:DEAD/DEAH box helicase [Nitrospirota bacterium]